MTLRFARRLTSLTLVSLTIAGIMSGCSSTPSKDDEAETESNLLPDIEVQTELDVQWRRTLGQGPGRVYTRLRAVVADSTVYAADTSGSVYALDLEDGSEQWQITFEQPITAGVTEDNGQLFIATQDGVLHCLSAADGSELWSSQLTSESIAPVGLDERRVFAHTIDGRVSAFERDSGKQAWSYENAMPVLSVRGTGAPLVLENLVITGFATGKLVALDKTLGIPRWDKRLAVPDGRSELERLVDVDGAPIWDEGRIYAASYHGKMAALTINGQADWEEDASSYTSPALALGNLYLTLDDGSVQSFDQRNGASQWLQTGLRQRDLGQVTAHENHLAVADGEGYVHLLRQVDGELVGRIHMRPKPLHISYPNQGEATNWRALRGRDFGIRSPLVSTDEGLLVYTNAGELSLLKLEAMQSDSEKRASE